MSTVGEQLVHVLRQAGVARVYGVVGDSLNPFVDAIRRTEGIEWIHVRDEEAGAFAAAADAQLTGRLAVCAGSCGPGNTHLIQGLYDAHRGGAPRSRSPRTSRRSRSGRRMDLLDCQGLNKATAFTGAERAAYPAPSMS